MILDNKKFVITCVSYLLISIIFIYYGSQSTNPHRLPYNTLASFMCGPFVLAIGLGHALYFESIVTYLIISFILLIIIKFSTFNPKHGRLKNIESLKIPSILLIWLVSGMIGELRLALEVM